MASPFIGQITIFGGNFAPRGYAFCDGQLLAIAQYTALFSLLGTTYGGDGRTTFGLPDLRGRSPLHEGNGPALSNRVLGAKGGEERVTLTTQTLPSHNHTITGSVVIGTNENAATTNEASGNVLAAGKNIYNSGPADPSEGLGGISTSTGTLGNHGQGFAHNNMQPFLVITYIIALQGVYPS